MNRRHLALPALASAALIAAAGCTAAGGPGPSGADGVSVLASFYPLQYVAEQVGGEHVQVDNLTPPSADPHDLELSPAQARRIGQVDLVVFQSGLQPAVDEGIEARAPAHVVDAAGFADLAAAEADEHAGEEHAGEEHAEDEHAGEEHEHGATDPHFWLDPSRLAALGQVVADELSAVDPEHADDYAAGAAKLGRDLEELDQEFADGLATCAGSTVVTSHAAFAYLADRYSLEQVGLTSFDPEAEPSPARLREVAGIARENDVTTVFSETLVSLEVAETLAGDLGLRTATLDPLEGLSEERLAEGADYPGVMRENLDALTEGLECE
ncbi:metal ABC transporter substrate-binding protein [Myceligenerans crystallogenes]|uniref:Zinc ABC transporter substrate-binding protein n=1 Tax=Myceligenerans crystallogenes TaxID=316335 RepID=A0ABN2NFV3_9MICO